VHGRLVLLGASNLVRGLRPVLRAARRSADGPLEVLAALGHGRSYGFRSRFVYRDLPAIRECGLWRALEERPPQPTRALVTDVGNDIAYGAPPEQILDWAEECVRRLRAHGAQVVIAGLPVERLERLSRAGYALVRSILFPFHRWHSLADALDRVREVTHGLARLAERHGATFVPLRPEWYGLDPIHIRPGAWGSAWPALLHAPEGGQAPAVAEVPGTPSWLRLYLLRPERQWLLGREQRRAQPALTLDDGGSVSLF
jgi:hypothetical protein